jgi:hypothetical protein
VELYVQSLNTLSWRGAQLKLFIRSFSVVCPAGYRKSCEGVSKSFRTESIKEITINTLREATQRVMAAKLTRLTHRIAIQLRLVA